MEIGKEMQYVIDHLKVLTASEKDADKNRLLTRIGSGLAQVKLSLVDLEQRIQALENAPKP